MKKSRSVLRRASRTDPQPPQPVVPPSLPALPIQDEGLLPLYARFASTPSNNDASPGATAGLKWWDTPTSGNGLSDGLAASSVPLFNSSSAVANSTPAGRASARPLSEVPPPAVQSKVPWWETNSNDEKGSSSLPSSPTTSSNPATKLLSSPLVGARARNSVAISPDTRIQSQTSLKRATASSEHIPSLPSVVASPSSSASHNSRGGKSVLRGASTLFSSSTPSHVDGNSTPGSTSADPRSGISRNAESIVFGSQGKPDRASDLPAPKTAAKRASQSTTDTHPPNLSKRHSHLSPVPSNGSGGLLSLFRKRTVTPDKTALPNPAAGLPDDGIPRQPPAATRPTSTAATTSTLDPPNTSARTPTTNTPDIHDKDDFEHLLYGIIHDENFHFSTTEPKQNPGPTLLGRLPTPPTSSGGRTPPGQTNNRSSVSSSDKSLATAVPNGRSPHMDNAAMPKMPVKGKPLIFGAQISSRNPVKGVSSRPSPEPASRHLGKGVRPETIHGAQTINSPSPAVINSVATPPSLGLVSNGRTDATRKDARTEMNGKIQAVSTSSPKPTKNVAPVGLVSSSNIAAGAKGPRAETSVKVQDTIKGSSRLLVSPAALPDSRRQPTSKAPASPAPKLNKKTPELQPESSISNNGMIKRTSTGAHLKTAAPAPDRKLQIIEAGRKEIDAGSGTRLHQMRPPTPVSPSDLTPTPSPPPIREVERQPDAAVQPRTPVSPKPNIHSHTQSPRSRGSDNKIRQIVPPPATHSTPLLRLTRPPPPEVKPEDPLATVQDPNAPVTFYPLDRHIADPALFSALLPYLEFSESYRLLSLSKWLRQMIQEVSELRETMLQHWLAPVGYMRWDPAWVARGKSEPIPLSLRDLNSYMRGVSMPVHEYGRIAAAYLSSRKAASAYSNTVRIMASCTRAYTRVVLRLRAQTEAETEVAAEIEREFLANHATRTASPSHPPSSLHSPLSRSSSEPADSPTTLSSHREGIPRVSSYTDRSNSAVSLVTRRTNQTFHSPLYSPQHSPLLQVFVPSPQGGWLSDESILECEKELRKAGVIELLRVGDIVWDVAAGDQANIGRLVWDGAYLIDLDYMYSRTGDLPPYIHSLAFRPSYWFRAIRVSSTPICYIDLTPWADEIARNLQLLQDRVKTQTPQGGQHEVVRWIHRSSFRIRAPRHQFHPSVVAPRLPIPHTRSLFVDVGWYGSVIVEAEGTNEGLADLQSRCKSAFAWKGREVVEGGGTQEGSNKVFRLLRERSQPGEIWIRTVREKERLLWG